MPDEPASAAADVRYVLGAIPLRRPAVRRFLRDWHVPARGVVVPVLEQRPTAAARGNWLGRLADPGGDPTSAALSIDDPMRHLGRHPTDRLVPREHLADDTFLERNLGGWAALWFGCVGLEPDRDRDDPMLAALTEIVDYGDRIAGATAPRDLVADRLDTEIDGGATALADGARALCEAGAHGDGDIPSHERIVALADATRGEGPLSDHLPRLLAYDELLEALYRLELRRRAAVDDDEGDVERSTSETQRRLDESLGVSLMLKGEYILGRHRRSTVLLAEGLGVVVKQPACEPEHDVAIDARTWDGESENWPVPDGDGRVVTSRARMAEVVTDEAVARLDRAFGRDVTFSTVLGLSVEPWESGPTLAELARRDHEQLTAERYDEVLVHELACEELGVENPDWHAANFIVSDDGLVHVDWGAARLLEPHERTEAGARERLDHVKQLAYSFQDTDLAERTRALHHAATGDPDHIAELRARARAILD